MLDSPEHIRRHDGRDMLRMVADMPENLGSSHRRGRSIGVAARDCKSLLICGVGGSAIGGDMICGWLSDALGIPCGVERSYSVPRHVGKETLVVVVSYSGNTEETLGMATSALQTGAEMVAISSGGDLKTLANDEGIPHCEIPQGLVPRATIGHLFGATIGVIESAGLAQASDQIDETVEVLGKVSLHCGPAVSTAENPAKKLAHELHGTVPVAIGYGLSRSVAKRWANQFNENAKMIAFFGEIPEMNHNGIVGWAKDGRSQGYSMMFLDHDLCSDMMSRRVSITKEMLHDRLRIFSSTAAGDSYIAKMFSLTMVGDYTSVYSALLRNEDPSTTIPIEELKRVLAEKGM